MQSASTDRAGDAQTSTDASASERPPGPDGLPILGSTLSVISDQLGFGERCAAEYGDVVHTRVAGREFYALYHPDHVERVLVTDADAFVRGGLTTGKLDGFAPNSLLLSDGERWQTIRQALQPAFYMDRVVEFTDEMGAIAAETVDGWDDGQRLDAQTAARRLTLRVLARTLFGADVREREATIRDAARAVRRRFDASSPSVFLPDWVPTPRIRRYRAAAAELDDLVAAMIRERRDRPEAYDDILAALVRQALDSNGGDIDEATLKDNAKGLLVAGHDTTAAALANAFGLLALEPDVQTRVRDEVRSVASGVPGADALGDLEYTDAVVRETLRLYPSAPALYRETRRPIAFDGYRIPAGADVTVSPWVTHRDDRWWSDPDEFRPERWLDDAEAQTASSPHSTSSGDDPDRPEYAYFPFGGGPRHCLGMRFAAAELKLAVATVCDRVALDTSMSEMPSMSGGMTLSPRSRIPVTVDRTDR